MSSTQSTLPTARLGSRGPLVPRLGLGLMGMSVFYGAAGSDEDRFKILDRAIEIGETFWDTADMYGDNEEMLGRYFKSRPNARAKVFLATKFSFKNNNTENDSSPEYIKWAIDQSLSKLGLDYVDLYYCHRVDGVTPIEKTMEALRELKQQGKIKYIGLSEVSARTLHRAVKVEHVDAVQLEYSPFSLECEQDEDERYGVKKACEELGVALVAYSPLGRGMMTGKYRSVNDLAEDDGRRWFPRFSDENFPKSLKVVDKFTEIAQGKGCTAGQLTLAWLLTRGEMVFGIPGTTKVKSLEENVASGQVQLEQNELDQLQTVIEAAEVQGDRYPQGFGQQLYADTPALE